MTDHVLPDRPVSDPAPPSLTYTGSTRSSTPCSGPPSLYALPETATSSATRVDDVHDALSTTRVLFVHLGAALTLFLATTDATIVSTSLPTIAKELNATRDQYSWVGVSYMLTQTAFQPLYGRISDLVGRKAVLYTSMMIFVIGSALCGAAQTIIWLIVARALAGIGGGGIVSAVWVITAEIVPNVKRAKWSQALSVTWACSAVAGPLLGGIFSGDRGVVSWRWGFLLNLPVCLVAFVVLGISLRPIKLKRSADASWSSFRRRFDFVGLSLFMVATFCVVLGFSYTALLGWTSPICLSLICAGSAIFVCGGVYDIHTKRDALFSPTTFKDLSAVILLVAVFLHNFAFTAGTFYLALYFQAANGMTPVQAGVMLLPYSLGSSLASMPAAWFMGYWQARSRTMEGQKWVVCSGLAISAVGFGLMATMDEHASSGFQIGYPLLSGIGIGMLFHAPYQLFTSVLPADQLGSGTSAFFLVRFTGATVGLSVGGAIFYNRLSASAPAGFIIPGSDTPTGWTTLGSLQPSGFRADVLSSVSSSLQAIWVVCAPCLAAACLICLFIRKLPVRDSAPFEASASEKLAQIKTSMSSDSPVESKATV